MKLYAAGDIEPLRPLNVIGPTEISEALQSIPSDMISGKIVVSYDQDALFKVRPQSPVKMRSINPSKNRSSLHENN